VENLKRVVGSARSRLLGRLTTPWSAGPPGLRIRQQKVHEGKGRATVPSVVREKLWRGAFEAQESFGRVGASAPIRNGLSRGSRPWSRGASRPSGPQSRRMRCQKRQEGTGAERRTAPREGNALKGEPHERHRSWRPGSSEGVNRQEGEKPCRRNVPGLESRVKRTSEPVSL